MKNFFLIFFSVLLLSCSSSDKKKSGKEAQNLYNEAVTLKQKKRYTLALERLDELQLQHPYTGLITPAELLRGEILFAQKLYEESAGAFSLFKDLHPRHRQLDYVYWMLAESFRHQLPRTHDRDLGSAYQAINFYEALIRRFPSSDYVASAREQITVCERMLLNKERSIADFYFKTKKYQAAHTRYLKLFRLTQDASFAGQALTGMMKSSLAVKDREQCLQNYQQYLEQVATTQKPMIDSLHQKCVQLP